MVKLLERFGMTECKAMVTPMEMNFKNLCGKITGPDKENSSEYRQLIGSLMFLVNTHIDICYVVNTLIHSMINLLHSHWIEANHVLSYL